MDSSAPVPRAPWSACARHRLAGLCVAVLGSLPAAVLPQVAQQPLLMGSFVPPYGTLGEGQSCGPATGASLSFSTSTLTDDALLVQAGFIAASWEGHVRAFAARSYVAFLEGTAGEPTPLWAFRAPPPAGRNVHTSTAQWSAVPFAWCRLSAEQRARLDPAAGEPAGCEAVAPALVDYLRGDAAMEQRNGGPFRDRPATVLGDVVNSLPVHSRAADHAYHLAPAASLSSTGGQGPAAYRAYVQWKRTGRRPIVLFGANDGMLHVLDARSGQPTSGLELFAYVPRAVFPELRALSDPGYSHRYTVDGPVVEGDVWTGTAWKTIAIGTTGAGPAGVFAIDITAPNDAMDAQRVLWDVTPADHPSADVRALLGRTLGAGAIASVRRDADRSPATEPNGAWAYLVGNGYESERGTAALLVFDALDGTLIRAIDTGVGGPGTPNGLGALAPVHDGQRNVVAVYAGDKLGNLWKFDLASSDPAAWRIHNETLPGTPGPLFTATEPGITRPIHQAPRMLPHPRGGLIVAFGSGKYFEVGDPENGDDQGIFVLHDAGQAAPVAFADLEPVRTEEYRNGDATYRRLYRPDLANVGPDDKGYWIRLRPYGVAASRERVIAPLYLDAGVLVVSTFSPGVAGEACAGAGRSHLYRIDILGGFTRGGFGAEGGATVARGIDGLAAGFVPLHRAADGPGETVRAVSASERAAMLDMPRYRLSAGSGTVQTASEGTCAHAAARVDGSVVRIETNCAGLLPLRAWRPLR